MPTPGDVAQWTCQVSKLDESGTPKGDVSDQNPVTVGELFSLACEGANIKLNLETLSLELPETSKYALRILQTRRLEPGRGEFIATTWMGSTLEFKELIMSDGETRVNLAPLKIAVKSVIPEEKAQNPEPFGPYSPISMSWPPIVWIALAVFAAVIGAACTWGVWVVIRRRRFKSLLARHPIALTPFDQLNKELRKLVRAGPGGDSGSYLRELDEAFRWYLAREIKVPTLGVSPKKIARGAAKTIPENAREVRRDLILALNEIEKGRADTGRLSEFDLQQLTELCRSVADRIHQMKEAG